MKTLLLVVMLLSAWTARAQVIVDGVDINKLDITYCHLYGVNGTIISKPRVWVDYGQNFRAGYNSNQLKYTNADGKAGFNSVIDAVNFMVQHGWELISWQLAADREGSPQMAVYLFRRKGGIENSNP